MKIIHIISSLKIGGAEKSLVQLLRYSHESTTDLIRVISLTRDGELKGRIEEMGYKVHEIGLSKNPLFWFRLIWIVREILYFKPEVIQCWMYHSDLIGGLIGNFCRVKVIVWNVRGSSASFELNKLSTYLIIKICGWVSSVIPTAIITNSQTAIEAHVLQGYDRKKFHLIYNGVDTRNFFKLAPLYKAGIKRRLGIQKKALIVGMIGRFDKLKNQKSFIKMIASLKRNFNWHSLLGIMVGPGIVEENYALKRMIAEPGCGKSIILLGTRSDINDILNVFDILVLPSLSEGFPNIVGEAMACGVPVVATRVGDVEQLVGEVGRIVDHPDPDSLASEVDFFLRLSQEKRDALSKLSRKKIAE
ncbi:MAG: glycosyltransferase, partial [Saprospiraceae bacterium]|nr:glycosyltransferase [Saprospiraceae bacterium]